MTKRTTITLHPAIEQLLDAGSVQPTARLSDRINTLAQRYATLLGNLPSWDDQQWFDFIQALGVVNLAGKGLQFELIAYFKASKVNPKLGYTLDSLRPDQIFAAVDYGERFIGTGRAVTLAEVTEWNRSQAGAAA